jgi:transposase
MRFAMNENTRKDNPIKHKNKLGYIDPTIAGIDIGDKIIHVAIPDGEQGVYVKDFGTKTPDLRKIAQVLKKAGVTTAVMEATGVYWIPLFEILEDNGFKSVLVDAKSVKNVPGRKSDVVDCQWIQTLYSNGLLSAAFRPPRERIKLRSYVRQRMGVVKTKQYALLHLEKALQLMNIKLSTALSDIAGISGFDIIRAIAAGERDPITLAKLRNKTCKKPEQVFIDALTGNYQDEHIFALQQALELYDFSNKQLEHVDRRVEAELETYPDVTDMPLPERDKDKKKDKKYATRRKPKKNEYTFDVRTLLWKKSGVDLTAHPGISDGTALLIFAEIGGDVSAWRSSRAFGSWLKLAPGNNISGGKRRRSKNQPCSNPVAQGLRMSAVAAKKTDTAIGAHVRRICGRTDKPKGIKAGAHKLAKAVYGMYKHGWQYYEKGADHYEKMHEEIVVKKLHKKAKTFGYKLVPIAA